MEVTLRQPSSSLKDSFLDCMNRLQSMATDHRRFNIRLDDAIFLDDLLRRLRLWTVDVCGAEKLEDLLDWVEQIQLTAVTLTALISGLSEELQALEMSITKKVSGEFGKGIRVERGTSEPRSASISELSRKGLTEAVTKLTMYTAPLQAAANVAQSERTTAQSIAINKRLSSEPSFNLSKMNNRAPYVLLDAPLPARETDRLLGTIVQEPGCFHDSIPSHGLQERMVESGDIQIEEVVTENYSLLMEKIMTKALGKVVTETRTVTLGPITIGPFFSPAYSRTVSTSRFNLRSPRVTTRFINPPDSYIKWVLDKYLEASGNRPKFILMSRSAYLIIGVKILSADNVEDDMIFAVGYQRIKYRQRLIDRSLSVTKEDYKGGALF